MKYTLDVSKLETQEVEVRQFEHNVTTVNADFTPDDIGEDLQDLTPCVLLSVGDKITSENGLSYIITTEQTAICWEVSEAYTQRAGTFFAQFGFIAADGTMKAYTEKFVFRVLPSVDWQKAAFEYKPRFIEAFWNKIVEKIAQSVPTKLSQLENDKSFVSTPDGLAEYAKTTEVAETLKGYATNASVEEKVSACAQSSQVEETLKSYAKTAETDEKLKDYTKSTELNTALSDYAKTTAVDSKISTNNKKWHSEALCSSGFPAMITTLSNGNVTFEADSTSTYLQSAFVKTFKSSGENAKLYALTLLLNTSKKTSPVTADLEIYLNGLSVTSSATAIGTIGNVLVKDEPTIAIIGLKKIGNEFALFYTRYNSASSTTPVATSFKFLQPGVSMITGLKFKFVPSQDTPATTNFTNIVKFTVSGERAVN